MTGGTGQLATALAAAGREPVRRVGRPGFDFDRPESVDAAFRAACPALVVNAAAYTGVDAAETDAEAAFRANRDGPARLARLCAEADVPLIHVSTDYVFDGMKGAPYVETDPTAPQGVYGASKLAGEQAVLEACPRAIVLRTSWVYAATGKNFVRTMLDAARQTRTGCASSPTRRAARPPPPIWPPRFWRSRGNSSRGRWQDRSAACSMPPEPAGRRGTASRVAIFEEAARHGLAPPTVEPITTADWPTPARRPPDSRLDCGKLAAIFGVRLPPWRDSLGPTVDAIFASERSAP